MPRPRNNQPPKYKHHLPSGTARVRVRDAHGNRRDLSLGEFGSSESHQRYQRVLATLSRCGGVWPYDRGSESLHDRTIADAPLSLEDHLNSDWARLFHHWKDHPDQCPEPEFARALIEQDEAILHQILTNGTKDELDRIWERIDAMIQRGLSEQFTDSVENRDR